MLSRQSVVKTLIANGTRCLAVSARTNSTTGSIKVPDPNIEYVPATKKDREIIMRLLVDGFLQAEPHSRAINISPQAAAPLFGYILDKALHYPFCMLIRDKQVDQHIGFRLMSIGHKTDFLKVEDLPELDEKCMLLGKLLDNMKMDFFKKLPDVHTVLRREITFVNPKWQRRGIAKQLVHLNIDFDLLKAHGVQGIVSEASSLANQSLLQSHGYKCLGEVDQKFYHDHNIQFDDGTQTLKCFFKDLR